MNFFSVLLQAIVQGLTEFLPVSSSGHLSLVQHFTKFDLEGAQAFAIFLHLGTLIAVLIAFRELIWELIREFGSMVADLVKRKFSWKLEDMSANRRMVIMLFVATFCAVVIFLPLLGIFGIHDANGELVKNLADLSKYTSEDNDIVVEGVALLTTGALLLYATLIQKDKKRSVTQKISGKHAIVMGLGQSLAAGFPGLSRSGTTTTFGMIAGLEKNTALQFSFIMSIPAILAANLLEFVKMDSAAWSEFQFMPALIGIIVAGIVGILAIKALKWVVANDKLNYFGYYCLGLGAVVIIIGIIEHAS